MESSCRTTAVSGPGVVAVTPAPTRSAGAATNAALPSTANSSGAAAMDADINSAEMSVSNDRRYAATHNIGVGAAHGPSAADLGRFGSEPVLNPDGTPLLDHNGRTIPVEKLLGSKPLRSELATRAGPGGRKLTYMSGDSVTRTLNDVFGFDGWCLDIKDTKREECMKDEKGRFHVAYTATVRVTHRRSGTYKEDCGSGDSIDRSLGTAVSHALKGAVTDAMKRAAKHFGEKLGNALYSDGFAMNKAPNTLKQALDTYDIERAKSKFGFEKDRKAQQQQQQMANTAANAGNGVASGQQITGSNTGNMHIEVSGLSSIQNEAHGDKMGTVTLRRHNSLPGTSSSAQQPKTPSTYASNGHQRTVPGGIQPQPLPSVGQAPKQAAPTVQQQQYKPRTSIQGLPSSNLMDLSQFAAGRGGGGGGAGVAPPANGANITAPSSNVFTDITNTSNTGENMAKAEPEPERPSTSRGRGPMAGKSPLHVQQQQQLQQQQQQHVGNPYNR